MEAARQTEVIITATSTEGFEEAIREGVARAAASLRGVQRVEVRDQRALVESGNVVGYQVDLVVAFVDQELELRDSDASVVEGEEVGVVLDPDEYRRLSKAAEELEDLQAYDEAVMELRTGEDVLIEWGEKIKAEIEIERDELRRRGAL